MFASECFNRTDASVTGQILKLMAAKPDAVLIAGAGKPTVLPERTLIECGYKGAIYQTQGIATPKFIKLGGKDVEGTLFPTQPVVLARTLPADHPSKKAALASVDAYEAKYGKGTVTHTVCRRCGRGLSAAAGYGRTGAEGRAAWDGGVSGGIALGAGTHA